MSYPVPTTGALLSTLTRITWKRMVRGKALWVCFFIALLPVLAAFALRTHDIGTQVSYAVEVGAMALVTAVFLASSIGDEIEDRTSTYLWSRPLPRWVVIVGKLLACAPVAIILIVGGWTLANVAAGHPPSAFSVIAFAVGTLTISTIAAGIVTLVPQHGMALTVAYIVILDGGLNLIPAKIQAISVTRQVRLIAGLEPETALVQPIITLVIIGAIWLAIGLWRVRKLES
jgi:hypothetical protein